MACGVTLEAAGVSFEIVILIQVLEVSSFAPV